MASAPNLLSTTSAAALTAAQTAAPPVKEEDPFAAAFAQITAEEARPPAAPDKTAASVATITTTEAAAPAAGNVQEGEAAREAAAAEKVRADAAAAEAAKTVDPAVAEAARVAADAAAETEAARVAAEAAKPQPPADDEIVRRLATLLNKPPAQEVVQDRGEEPFAPTMPPGAKEIIDQYAKDFPDVMKAEGLIRQIEYQHVVAYVFKNVTAFLAPHLEMLNEIASRTHLGDIQQQVPDYAQVRAEAVEWVKKQPDYLRQTFERVIASGTKDQVVDLIRRSQADKVRATTAQADPALAANQNTQRSIAAIDPAKAAQAAAVARAAAALAPVGTKRTNIPVQAELTDFDSAFDQFAKLA